MRLVPRIALTLLIVAVTHGMALAGDTVSFKAGDEKINAYLAVPAGMKPATPGIVIVHEWWGLNPQIKGVADRLSGLGYVAMVPDLYRGKLPTDPGLAHELMRGLNENRAIGVIKGAVDFLRERGRPATRRVGLIGYCMGGRLALAAAITGLNVQATVMYYGGVETTPEAVAALRSPILGLFGDEDRGIPVADVKKFETALKEEGKKARIVVFSGVGHAFANEEQTSYDSESAVDAWSLTKDFLRENLGTGADPKAVNKAPGVPDKPDGEDAKPAAPGSTSKPPEKVPPGPKPPASSGAP